MNIEFTFKNFEPSEHLKKYARRRFEKIARFLGKSPALQMQVLLSVDKYHQKVEISLTGEGLNINATESSKDMYATIDMISDKISSQVRRSCEKLHSRQKSRDNVNVDIYSYDVIEEDGVQVVNGEENFARKPLHMDEAIIQLQQSGSEVLVFINADLDRINVIYRKNNGDFGVIDPIV